MTASNISVAGMQVSAKPRRGDHQFFHWCPGCELMHPLPDTWTFNDDLDRPTFTPSFLQHTSRGPCHYILTDGVLNYCGDCFHVLKGQAIPLPDLPVGYRDDNGAPQESA